MRRRLAAIVLAAPLCAPFAVLQAQAADGLALPSGDEVWPQWQARLTVSAATLNPVSLFRDPAAQRSTLQSGSLLGDYYLRLPAWAQSSAWGGVRATGGLLLGPRGLALGGAPTRPLAGWGLAVQGGVSPLASDPGSDAAPYLGVGYTSLDLHGGWGVTADLGWVADHGDRVGRALLGSGGQSLDAALRDLRLSPVVQVGVRYAF